MNHGWELDKKRQKVFKVITYLFTFICILIILEITGYIRLSFALKKELPVEVMQKMINWFDYFHHHRGGIWLNPEKSPESLVFEMVKFGKEFILLQGDSWIERIEIDPVQGKPKKNGNSVFFNELPPSLKSYGYINAGIGSFSPSLAEGQLRFLKKEFDIDPEFIIMYIDQTDFGDELYRYSDLIKRVDGNIVKISEDNFFQFKSQYKEIIEFEDSKLKAIGLIRYEFNKFIRKLRKDNQPVQLEKILDPLTRNLSVEENEKIKLAILGYINEALRSNRLKKLLIVSHPHLKHLEESGNYKNQIHTSIVSAYHELNEDQKNKVCIAVIDPSKVYKFKSIEDIFYSKDPTSHLQSEYQVNQFPKTLANLLNSCANNKSLLK